MKAVYVEENEKILKYFVFGLKQNEDECEEYRFEGIKTIAERAFYSPCNVKRMFFDETLTTIKKEAFKDCDELKIFCCGSEGDFNLLKGINPNELLDSEKKSENTFSVETSAFANCESLHTVIFPKCKTLKIEKNAFSGCSSLRTVVAVTGKEGKIDFTGNPFEDCPKELVFVCSKNSAVERFARENGYRYVYVQ